MGILFDELKRINTGVGGGRDTSVEATRPLESPVVKAADKPVLFEPAVNQKPDLSGMTQYDIVQKYGRPRSYEDEIREAERKKRLGVLSDVLSLGVDVGTSMAGRRTPVQIQSQTDVADARLQRLKDLQRADDIRFGNALLQARLGDRADAKAGEIAKQRDQYLRDKMKLDNAAKMAEIKRKMGNDAYDRAFKQKQFDADERYRKNSLAVQWAKANKEKASDKDKYDYLVGKDGRITRIPKDMSTAVAGYLYSRMRDILAQNPQDKRTLDDIKMEFGEGGDQSTKMLAIVKRKIKEFPELQDESEAILSGQMPVNSDTQSADELYRLIQAHSLPAEKYEGPIRPAWQIKEDAEKKMKKGTKSLWGNSNTNTNKKIGW